MERIEFMGIMIDNLSLSQAIEKINDAVLDGEKMYVVTPNTDHIIKLQSDDEFMKAYKEAGLVLVDGTPIMWIARWYGTPLKEKITGPRLADAVLESAAKNGFTVFFIGGAEGVAKKASLKMSQKYPGLKTVGYYSPKYGFEEDEDEIRKILDIINQAHPDILIAGISSPKTEIFINKYISNMNIKVALSIGAAIDFMAGTIKRCPQWMNRLGLEWLYRLIKEPKRMFKRYFIDDMQIFKLASDYNKRRKKG